MFNEYSNGKFLSRGSRFYRRKAKRCEGTCFYVVGGKKRVSRHQSHWKSSISKHLKANGSNSEPEMFFDFFGRMVWSTARELQALKKKFFNGIRSTIGFKCSSPEECLARIRLFIRALKDKQVLLLLSSLRSIGNGWFCKTIFNMTAEEQNFDPYHIPCC